MIVKTNVWDSEDHIDVKPSHCVDSQRGIVWLWN